MEPFVDPRVSGNQNVELHVVIWPVALVGFQQTSFASTITAAEHHAFKFSRGHNALNSVRNHRADQREIVLQIVAALEAEGATAFDRNKLMPRWQRKVQCDALCHAFQLSQCAIAPGRHSVQSGGAMAAPSS